MNPWLGTASFLGYKAPRLSLREHCEVVSFLVAEEKERCSFVRKYKHCISVPVTSPGPQHYFGFRKNQTRLSLPKPALAVFLPLHRVEEFGPYETWCSYCYVVTSQKIRVIDSKYAVLGAQGGV